MNGDDLKGSRWIPILLVLALCSVGCDKHGYSGGGDSAEVGERAAEPTKRMVARTERISRQRAREAWKRNMKAFRVFLESDNAAIWAFGKVTEFFFHLTGIDIPADYSYAGTFPTADSAAALGPLERWYERHGERLYWSESTGRVEVRPPEDPLEKLWWEHEQALVEVLTDRHPEPESVQRARDAFERLCGTVFPLAGQLATEFRAVSGSVEALQDVRDCYDRIRPRLYLDKAGDLSLRD